MAYMLVDGTNDWAQAPSRAEYNPTDRIDARAEIDFDAYAVSQSIISRRGTGGTNGSFQFYMSGVFHAIRVWDGTGANTNYGGLAPTGATPGTPLQVRAVVDASDAQITFWKRATGTDLTVDTGWSQVGAAVALSPATLYASSTNPIEIGATAQGQLPATGKFYRACFKIDGTLRFDADPSDTNTWDCPDKLFFTEKANSATVTLQGDATLVGDCPSGNRMGGTGAIRKPPRY